MDIRKFLKKINENDTILLRTKKKKILPSGGHILSTEDGYPVSSGLSQVTIICKDSTKADALSTLCFILGHEKAASLLESFPDVRAVFITEDGEILKMCKCGTVF